MRRMMVKLLKAANVRIEFEDTFWQIPFGSSSDGITYLRVPDGIA